jgi:uncharacterized cupredoxin-like copper-binding protein
MMLRFVAGLLTVVGIVGMPSFAPAHAQNTPDQATYGDWLIRVTGVEIRTEPMESSAFGSISPHGKFVVVYLEVTNDGLEADSFPYYDLALKDGAGRKYTSQQNATISVQIEELDETTDDYQPGLTYTTAIVFDVPLDAEDFTLTSEDDAFTLPVETGSTLGTPAPAEDELVATIDALQTETANLNATAEALSTQVAELSQSVAAPNSTPEPGESGTRTATLTAEPIAVVIELNDIYFEPETVTIAANTPVTVTLTNSGAAPHNFSIDQLQIDQDVQPGETKTITITAPAGTYQFYCNVPGHKEAGMVGTLTVAAPGGAPAGGESPTVVSAQNQPAPTELTLKLVDIAFDPKDFTIAANTDVVIHLQNTGASMHNFSIDALGISQDVIPGETTDITINAPAGTIDYYCAVPGHKEAGMEGTITVAESGAAGQSPAAGGATAPAASGQIEIDLQDIKFVPDTFTIPANTPTTVTLTNIGAVPHNFSIDALNISEDVAPGESVDIAINAPAGTYEYYCAMPGHKAAGMVGTLTVR